MKNKPFFVGIVLGCVLAFFGVALATHAESVYFNQNLYYGITNSNDVQALQEFLTVKHLYAGPITGNFYSLTQAAVRNYQSENGISPTGYFGVLSRGMANAELAHITTASEQSATASTTSSTAAPVYYTSGTPSGSAPSQNTTGTQQNQIPAPEATGGNVSNVPSGSAGAPVPTAPAPVENPLTCSFSATVVLFTQGTNHALFTWEFTPRATASINADLNYGGSQRGKVVTYTSAQQLPTFGPTIFADTEYTLTVTQGDFTKQCKTIAHF